MHTYLDEIIQEVNYEQTKPGITTAVRKPILLNTLLAGPILRRIEPKTISIWLATTIKPANIETKVMPLEPARKGIQPFMWLPADLDIAVKTKFNWRQVGKNLFIILLEVAPATGKLFSTETLYGYDILFSYKKNDTLVIDGNSMLLKADQKISFAKYYNKQNSYSYANIPYPVFVIPDPATPNSRILYGSCRKAHGPGSDALNAADNFMEKSWTDFYKSPGRIPNFSLFHLGDQIYTDDLSEDVFNYTVQLSGSLMGYQQKIAAYTTYPSIDENFLIMFLDNYLKGNQNFKIEDLNFLSYIGYDKTDKRKNIVLFLRKYFSTNYEIWKALRDKGESEIRDFLHNKLSVAGLVNKLFAVSGTSNSKIDLREIIPPPYMLFKLGTAAKPVADIGYRARKEFVKNQCSFSTSDDGHVLSFGEFAALYLINWGNPVTNNGAISKGDQSEIIFNKNKKVKRLLANVPSYMIFDDHDVTDDWNCDDVWKNRVEKSVPGKRIIANALAAYLFFQAWGNAPDTFADGRLLNPVTDHLMDLVMRKQTEDDKKAIRYENSLWYFKNWVFTAPTNPLAVFMDNRTMKYQEKKDLDYLPAFNNNTKYKGSRLLSPLGFNQLEALLKSAKFEKGNPIIFIAPTPVISAPLSQRLQIEMINGDFNKNYMIVTQGGFRQPGRYMHDWEMWFSNLRGKYELFNFIDTKISPSQVFILSGDVHYGFHATVNFESNVTRRKFQIEQLTSSALKNNTLGRQTQINKLANFSFLDTKDFHKINESYPLPVSTKNPPPIHFNLKGNLLKYTTVMDSDALLIPHNNLGVLEFDRGASFAASRKALFRNFFLATSSYSTSFIKSIQVPQQRPVQNEYQFEINPAFEIV